MAQQNATIADAGFAPGPPVTLLCGITLPTIPKFSYGFALPSLGLPSPFPPIPLLPLGLNCPSNNPLNITQGLKSGGGRKPNLPPDPDQDFLKTTPGFSPGG